MTRSESTATHLHAVLSAITHAMMSVRMRTTLLDWMRHMLTIRLLHMLGWLHFALSRRMYTVLWTRPRHTLLRGLHAMLPTSSTAQPLGPIRIILIIPWLHEILILIVLFARTVTTVFSPAQTLSFRLFFRIFRIPFGIGIVFLFVCTVTTAFAPTQSRSFVFVVVARRHQTFFISIAIHTMTSRAISFLNRLLVDDCNRCAILLRSNFFHYRSGLCHSLLRNDVS
jgi:hypothetical protein